MKLVPKYCHKCGVHIAPYQLVIFVAPGNEVRVYHQKCVRAALGDEAGET